MNRMETTQSSEEVVGRLLAAFDEFSPQLRKAARYIIDHPNEIALVPIRPLAQNAGVKPGTLVRIAATIGFDTFSAFRKPFRDRLRVDISLPERARRLEHEGDNTQRLYEEMRHAATSNLNDTFGSVDARKLRETADMLLRSKRVFISAVGSCYGMAHYLYYVARMAMPKVVLTPQQGSLAIDDLTDVGPSDLLIVLSFRPYRQETIDAARLARSKNGKVIAITDSSTAPIALAADVVFLVPNETPQFFPSMAAVVALVETLLAFVVARGGSKAVRSIETFNSMRHDFSIWWSTE